MKQIPKDQDNAATSSPPKKKKITVGTSPLLTFLNTPSPLILALVSRQTLGMTRGHIEGLLSSFPKLIIEGQQHTSVETDSVRYVFQPLSEDMYAVLITTKNSNIVQDMDTLQLIARSIPEVCKYISQEEIVENAFLLLNAFDEIISLGYRENIDLASLKTILEMDSQKEKIQDIIDR
ncbi:Coatomer subunit delta, partial [Smittium culicis]